MKKRNRVLEAILCAALAVAVFWGYMFAAKDNGIFTIEDIEGDRTALNAFAFEGLAGDAYGQTHYIWQDGELKTKYYAGTDDEIRYILSQERSGNKGVTKFFKRKQWSYDSYDTEITAAPAKDAAVRRLTKLTELQENLQEDLEEESPERAYTVEGVATDTLEIYGRLTEYPSHKTARFFTGLQLKGKEYQLARARYNDDSTYTPWLDYQEDVQLCVAEVGNAWYAIPKTGALGQGEVFLLRIPKDEMVPLDDYTEDDYMEWDALYSTKLYGRAEPIQTFSVDAENRIVALEQTGDNQLLLARTEQDALVLELYDTDGKRLDRLETGVKSFSAYTVNTVNIVRSANCFVLWFGVDKEISEEEYFYRETQATKCFAAEQGKIKEISIESITEYADVQDGKILKMDSTVPKNFAAEYFGSMSDGYDITVTDAETGKLLYRGRLKTDFGEDTYKELSAINISRRQKSIAEREKSVNWEKYNQYSGGQRSVGKVLPLNGKRFSASWENAQSTIEYGDD